MQVRDAMATKWSSNEIPNLGKDHSRADDNFHEFFPGQSASLMRCISGIVPVKIIYKDAEATVKKC